MLLALRQKLGLAQKTPARFLTFLVIGGGATVISVGGAEILYLLTGFPLWLVTIPMAQLAINFKWFFNRRLTWQVTNNSTKRFWLHELSCLSGVAIQLVVIAVLSFFTTLPPLFILGLGAISGTGLNFFINDKLVFIELLPKILTPAQHLVD